MSSVRSGTNWRYTATAANAGKQLFFDVIMIMIIMTKNNTRELDRNYERRNERF